MCHGQIVATISSIVIDPRQGILTTVNYHSYGWPTVRLVWPKFWPNKKKQRTTATLRPCWATHQWSVPPGVVEPSEVIVPKDEAHLATSSTWQDRQQPWAKQSEAMNLLKHMLKIVGRCWFRLIFAVDSCSESSCLWIKTFCSLFCIVLSVLVDGEWQWHGISSFTDFINHWLTISHVTESPFAWVGLWENHRKRHFAKSRVLRFQTNQLSKTPTWRYQNEQVCAATLQTPCTKK